MSLGPPLHLTVPKGSLPSSPQAGLIVSVKNSQPHISQLRTKTGVGAHEPVTAIRMYENVLIKPLFCKLQNLRVKLPQR